MIEADNSTVTFKVLPIFSTLRSNLALVDAFLRRSTIETRNYNGADLGFLGVEPGEEQLNIHNRSVAVIVVALLYQTLENYSDLRRISPKLGDPGLEAFFKSLGGRRKLFDGMKTVRKGVFHVRSLRSWRSRNARFLDEVCDERGGVLAVMSELRRLLYDFTEKVFVGDLRIWPNSVYDDMERWRSARPELVQKLESGDIKFSEFMDAMLSPESETSESG